jgi:hypothetical protein
MTTQTKKFIAPEDVIGLRFQCEHPECRATVILPLDKPVNTKRLGVCPCCLRPWLTTQTDSLVVLVDACIENLKNLKAQIASYKKNFSLTLEIKPEETAE